MKQIWTGRVISGLAVLPFLLSAAMKFSANSQVVEGFKHLGLPENLMFPLGVLELSCAVVYLVPQIAVLGAILLTGYVGGTIITHLRIGEPVYVQITLGILVWLGLYLRDEKLRTILPLRKI